MTGVSKYYQLFLKDKGLGETSFFFDKSTELLSWGLLIGVFIVICIAVLRISKNKTSKEKFIYSFQWAGNSLKMKMELLYLFETLKTKKYNDNLKNSS